MNKQRILWGILLVAVLAIGTVTIVSLRTVQAPVGNEPSNLKDIVEYPGADLREEIVQPLSPDWENYLFEMSQYPGTQQIYQEACGKYTCPGWAGPGIGPISLRDSCAIGSAGSMPDCVVRRTTGFIPDIPGPIPIEIVSLSLTSLEPITVPSLDGTQMAVTVKCDRSQPLGSPLQCSSLWID